MTFGQTVTFLEVKSSNQLNLNYFSEVSRILTSGRNRPGLGSRTDYSPMVQDWLSVRYSTDFSTFSYKFL